MRVQLKLYSYWVCPWHYLHNARFRGALRGRGVWRRLCELGVLLSQAAYRVQKCFGRRRLVPLLKNDLALEGNYVRLGP